MTRADLLAHARANLMVEYQSALDNWGGPSEQLLLDNAADQTAQASDCYHAEEFTDLVAGQAAYCAPKIYKVTAVYAVDADGHRRRLERLNSVAIARRFGNRWREWQPQDAPRYAVRDSNAQFTLAPAPLTSRTGGMIVAGFALSTLQKSGRANHQWDQGTDECPLPPQAHEAVLTRFCYLRLRQLAVQSPAVMPLAATYESEWRRQCGELESQAARAYNDAVRTRGVYSDYAGANADYGGAF